MATKDEFEAPAQWSTDTDARPRYVGDFNGDGMDDYYRDDLFEFGMLALSTGSSFTLRTIQGPDDIPWRLRAGDFNGDGKDDLMVNSQLAYVMLSGDFRSGFDPNAPPTFFNAPGGGNWAPPGLNGATSWDVGDFNGDGKDDIFRYQEGSSGADMYLSDGTKFVSGGSWTDAWTGTDTWYVGDFNGDGKDDIFRYVYGVSGADMFLSDGTKFVADGSWTPAGQGDSGWYVGDFNGDGMDDIARYLTGTSGADVWLSTGDAFVHGGSWTTAGQGTGGYGSAHGTGWEVGDFNGDLTMDLMRVSYPDGTDVLL